MLRDRRVVKTPTHHLSLGISDPDDEWIAAEALAGNADALVTGDGALYTLGKRAPLPIVTPFLLAWQHSASAYVLHSASTIPKPTAWRDCSERRLHTDRRGARLP